MSSRHGLAGVLGRRGCWACLLCTLLALMAFPAGAFAQATRTWVSGVGDDANPCSRTAPCKTWAGAISKTAAGGEIDALDPGGFGALTITKSITIDGGAGQVASVLVAGTNGFVVAASPSDHVILRNLRFQGLLGDGSNPGGAGINGVVFRSGASLRLDNVTINGFSTDGVLDVNNLGPSTLVIAHSTITDNSFGAGVMVAPGPYPAIAVLRNTALEANACGLVVSTAGTGSSTCGTGTGSGSTIATVTAFGGSMSANTSDGVFTHGGGARTFLSGNLITGNMMGIDTASGGQNIFLCGNMLGGNVTDGSPSSTVTAGCG